MSELILNFYPPVWIKKGMSGDKFTFLPSIVEESEILPTSVNEKELCLEPK